MSTPDLSDKYPNVEFINLQFRNFGKQGFYSGQIETVLCPDDNSKVKEILSTPGKGKILIVDGSASTQVALMGDMIAKSAEENNWKAVIINGCVRDVNELGNFNIGIFALGSVPRKSETSRTIGWRRMHKSLRKLWTSIIPGCPRMENKSTEPKA